VWLQGEFERDPSTVGFGLLPNSGSKPWAAAAQVAGKPLFQSRARDAVQTKDVASF